MWWGVSGILLLVLSNNVIGYKGTINGFGYVDYNDECEFVQMADPATFVSRLEEWKYCDTNRGLYCVPGLGRCGCLVPLTIYRGGKCRAKVDAGCIVKEYKLDCVDHATCNRNHSSLTWRCACDRGYVSNAENTACFSRYEWDYRRRNWYRERDGFYYFGAGEKPVPPFIYIFLIIIAVFYPNIYFYTDLI